MVRPQSETSKETMHYVSNSCLLLSTLPWNEILLSNLFSITILITIIISNLTINHKPVVSGLTILLFHTPSQSGSVWNWQNLCMFAICNSIVRCSARFQYSWYYSTKPIWYHPVLCFSTSNFLFLRQIAENQKFQDRLKIDAIRTIERSEIERR